MLDHSKLHARWALEEMAIFPIWQAADSKERERIVKAVAERQAKELFEKIDQEIYGIRPRVSR